MLTGYSDSLRAKEVVSDGIAVSHDLDLHGDGDGSHCLNDARKGAGALPRHNPSRWKDNTGTQDLLEKLVTENPDTKVLYVRKGYAVTGTYAVKELVYADAM